MIVIDKGETMAKPEGEILTLDEVADINTAYMPLHGFTAVDLGYQQGNAVSNLVHKMDDAPFATTYLGLFDQIWNDPEKLEDVAKEKQFNRKVELNATLRQLKVELQELTT